MFFFKGDNIKGKLVVIFGFGNVVQYVCEKVIVFGVKVIILLDLVGIIYDLDGIILEKLVYVLELKNVRCGWISEYVKYYKVVYLEGKKFWGVKCDVVFLCVMQNEVGKEDVEELVKNGCICVVEGVNMLIQLEVVRVLQKNKVLFGLGKVLNVGGVVVFGLEMI